MKKSLAILTIVAICAAFASCAPTMVDDRQNPKPASQSVTSWSIVADQMLYLMGYEYTTAEQSPKIANWPIASWSIVADQMLFLMDYEYRPDLLQPKSELTEEQKQAINEAIAAREHILTGY